MVYKTTKPSSGSSKDCRGHSKMFHVGNVLILFYNKGVAHPGCERAAQDFSFCPRRRYSETSAALSQNP